ARQRCGGGRPPGSGAAGDVRHRARPGADAHRLLFDHLGYGRSDQREGQDL
ncbi:MAG: hypothetical protein AVDCRST_MAG54-66, partial [uncultured Actinomycetospora sp.]